jgi:hypothetical protein
MSAETITSSSDRSEASILRTYAAEPRWCLPFGRYSSAPNATKRTDAASGRPREVAGQLQHRGHAAPVVVGSRGARAPDAGAGDESHAAGVVAVACQLLHHDPGDPAVAAGSGGSRPDPPREHSDVPHRLVGGEPVTCRPAAGGGTDRKEVLGTRAGQRESQEGCECPAGHRTAAARESRSIPAAFSGSTGLIDMPEPSSKPAAVVILGRTRMCHRKNGFDSSMAGAESTTRL